jgi:hypothetical protein
MHSDGVYVWQYMWRLDDLAATQSFLQSVLPNFKKGAGTPTTPRLPPDASQTRLGAP